MAKPKRKLKHCTDYKYFKEGEYIYEPVNHPIFGHIRTFIINNERYYSTSDIARSIGSTSPHNFVYGRIHSAEEDLHYYVKFVNPGSNYTTRIRVLPAELVLIVIAGSTLRDARKLIKFILKIEHGDFVSNK